jgi:hypothetical protein
MRLRYWMTVWWTTGNRIWTRMELLSSPQRPDQLWHCSRYVIFQAPCNIRWFLDIIFFFKNHAPQSWHFLLLPLLNATLPKIIFSVFLNLSLQGVSYSTFPLVICQTTKQYQTEFPNIESSCSSDVVTSGRTLGKSERVEGQESLHTCLLGRLLMFSYKTSLPPFQRAPKAFTLDLSGRGLNFAKVCYAQGQL